MCPKIRIRFHLQILMMFEEPVTAARIPADLDSIRSLRVALLHDWLFHMRGGEKCLRDIAELFPNSEIFTLFAGELSKLNETIAGRPIFPSVLNRIPLKKKIYRSLLPFFPIGVKSLESQLAKRHNVAPFDLVISVSHCAVKNVRAPEGVPHICYCLTPARYLWDQFERYIKSSLGRVLLTPMRNLLRQWDIAGSKSVDRFICISKFVADRLKRCYGREADVIYPGVDLDPILPTKHSTSGEFLTVNALVPYKNTEIIVEAFKELELPLRVIGSGAQESFLRARAGKNTVFERNISLEQLWKRYRECSALVFAAEEDFGMTPVEVQSSGKPVICLGRGGCLETVIPGVTGEYFFDITPHNVAMAVRSFMDRREGFSLESCRRNSELFSRERFFENFLQAISRAGIASKKVTEEEVVGI